MRLRDECVEKTDGRTIVVKENGKRFELNNPCGKQVRKIRVDNCVIKGNRKRCDFLLEIAEPTELAVYVEFKGTDLEHACDQLAETLKYFVSRHKDVERKCYIVACRIPKAGPAVQVLKKKFQGSTGTQLFVGTVQVSCGI